MSAESDIAELYVGYFDRAPDPAGFAYWLGRYSQGMSIEEIAQSFSAQPEARNEYSYLSNPTQAGATEFINDVYNNLFGRDVEPAGLQYWLNDLAQRGSPSLMVLAMINGALGDDAIAVQNQVSVGLYYTKELVENNKPWSPESAVSVIDEVNQTSETVRDGYYEVDQYILNGAINPPNFPGGPLNPDWPPLTGLPSPVGPLLGDVLGTVNTLLADATTLNVGGLLGNLLGNVLHLVDNLTDNVGNIVGFQPGITDIDLTDLDLGNVANIVELGNLGGLGINEIFDGGSIVRGLLDGQSLVLVDANDNGIFDVLTDLQLLGLGSATISDFTL